MVYCKINTLGKRAQTKKGGPRRRRPVIVHASAPMPWSPFENAPLGPLRCRFGNRPSAISHTDLSGVGRFLFLGLVVDRGGLAQRSEEHTYDLQSLMRISFAFFCFK